MGTGRTLFGLLVAYFHERENPVQNGLRVWSVYRLADAAFLIAALLMHHLTGHGDFASFVGVEPWPEGQSAISSSNALMVGLLMLLAASGKSALIPFSGWLPRAMEGPTPSSAVFYGALSVHLGAYLLLRISPIIEQSVILQICVIASGLASAWLAGIMSRVQTDVKSALAYASLTQVGLIVAEIGFGFYYLALIHIIGHACLRTLQLLRAPTLLTDYAAVENAMGASIVSTSPTWYSGLPKSLRIFSTDSVSSAAISTLSWTDLFSSLSPLHCDGLIVKRSVGPTGYRASNRENPIWSNGIRKRCLPMGSHVELTIDMN